MRARLLEGAADLAIDTDDDETARLRAQEGIALSRELGDDHGAAHCTFLLGLTHTGRHEWSAAHDALAEAIRLYRELGDERHARMATRRLAWTYEHLHGPERATALHEENLRSARTSGDRAMQAETLAVLGQYALERGEVEEGVPMLKEAYDLHRGRPDFPERYQTVILVCRFAYALALAGRPREAAALLACAPARFEELGVALEPWVAKINEATLELVRAELDDAEFEQAREEGRRLTVDEAIALAVVALEA